MNSPIFWQERQLEQISQLYDDTINDHLFTSDTAPTGMKQHESNIVMQQLASSIDLHKLASLYYNQLKSKLNIDAVTIKFPTGLITIGEAPENATSKSLDQSINRKIFATLVYSFSKVLSMREHAILIELHRLFKFPLNNALEYHSIKQLALKDHLTSLGNRANYQETLLRLISQAHRYGEGFGLLVIDMDKFKHINDTFGHHEGDKVLIAVAEVLRHSLRDTDYAFRFGGDEFCCLLPGSQIATNSKIAQRIQLLMKSDPVLSRHAVSCSIGSTVYLANDSEQDIFNRADSALYQAKQNGRACYKAA